MSEAKRARVPAVEGWFTLDEPPHLIGTRCTGSGTYFFPPERTMSRVPGHSDAALEDVELSRTGTLWSFTNAGYQPPEPFVAQTDPFVPFCIAAVELEKEKIVVLGQCVAGVTVDDLRVGTQMELVLDVLDRTEDEDLMIWKWQPVGWSTGSTDGSTTEGSAA